MNEQALTAREVFPAVRARIDRELANLADDQQMREAVTLLLQTRAAEDAMLLTPLLVHTVETGGRGNVLTIASAHHLWWLAAHVMDDVIDESPMTYENGLSAGDSVMAAVYCGISLPTMLISADYAPDTALAIMREYAGAWTTSNNGQIRDLHNRVGEAGCAEVMRTYHDKNGAAYGMACAAAALAAGAHPARVAAWREFGYALGAVGQFRNDQEDIVSGQAEDLRNRTATFLLTHFLENCCGTTERAHWLDVLGSADATPDQLDELTAAMLEPRALAGYYATVAELRDRAAGLLHDLTAGAADPDATRRLQTLVAEAATPVDGFPPPIGRVSAGQTAFAG